MHAACPRPCRPRPARAVVPEPPATTASTAAAIIAAGKGPLRWSQEGLAWPNRSASRFVDAGGVRWHLQRLGAADAPVCILLLHGTGASTHSWRDLAPRVASGQVAVIAPDLPGHGFSETRDREAFSLPGMAQALATMLRTIEASPTLVCGHSAGAALGARLCLDGGARPRTLVAINGAWLPFGGLAGRLFSPAARLLAASGIAAPLIARRAADPALAHRLLAGTGSRIDRDGAALYGRLMRSPAHVAGALAMMAAWDLAPLLREMPRLAPRLLLLAGAADTTVPAAQSARIAAQVAGARLDILPALGHLAHEEAPERFASCLLAAVAEDAAMHRG